MMTDNTTTGADDAAHLVAPVAGGEDAAMVARLERIHFVLEYFGWIPADQVNVERNELRLDDYLSGQGHHSYLEKVELWEVQPGEGAKMREALLMLPDLLREYQVQEQIIHAAALARLPTTDVEAENRKPDEPDAMADALEPFARWARWALQPHLAATNDRKLLETPGMMRDFPDDWKLSQHLSPDEPRLRLGDFRKVLAALGDAA